MTSGEREARAELARVTVILDEVAEVLEKPGTDAEHDIERIRRILTNADEPSFHGSGGVD